MGGFQSGLVGLTIPAHVVLAQGRVQTGIKARLLFRVEVRVQTMIEAHLVFRVRVEGWG